MIYSINERPHTLKEWILYATQQVLSVFVATTLISTICGTPIDSGLLGGCLGTLVYQFITKGQSPMFISNCGATVSAVIGALAIGTAGPNYVAVAIGGIIIFLTYSCFSYVIKRKGIEVIDKYFPPIIIGPITMVIGANLASFINTYVQVNGTYSNCGVIVAVLTMAIVALTSHYFKGFWKTIPFLLGLLGGYMISLLITVCGIAPLINFNLFKNLKLFALPEFTFLKWKTAMLSWSMIPQVIIMFLPVAICAICEHYSDHKVLSNIIGTDLTYSPGLHKTLLGDGVASLVGTIICGLPNTSYGEAIATIGFSRVASRAVITLAALMLGALAFVQPVQAFVASIPSCVFGGCAMILYGYIFSSGLKTLFNSNIDFEDNKNLIVISVIITVGVSGIYLFNASFAGVSLAMVLGVILNLVLRSK